MQIGKMRAHIRIAFIGTYHEFTGLRNSKVYAGQCGFAGKKFATQVQAGCMGKEYRISIAFRRTQVLMKQCSYLFFLFYGSKAIRYDWVVLLRVVQYAHPNRYRLLQYHAPANKD